MRCNLSANLWGYYEGDIFEGLYTKYYSMEETWKGWIWKKFTNDWSGWWRHSWAAQKARLINNYSWISIIDTLAVAEKSYQLPNRANYDILIPYVNMAPWSPRNRANYQGVPIIRLPIIGVPLSITLIKLWSSFSCFLAYSLTCYSCDYSAELCNNPKHSKHWKSISCEDVYNVCIKI